MTQSWRRRGILINAPTPQAWARSHAALPVAARRTDNGFELHYSARDARNRAHIGRAHIGTGSDGLVLLAHDDEPVLTPGPLGAFDDCGVTSSCIVELDEERSLLFFTGWTLTRSVPFNFFVGAAESRDGGRTFARISPAPVLGRSAVDPFLTASPSVLRESAGWRMWYVSCEEWLAPAGNEEPRHRYHVRIAESDDGLSWTPTGRVAIDFASDDEYAIARPHVVRESGRYRMWFCARGDAYRLGYAESPDGEEWTRDDAAVSLVGQVKPWETEMAAYPHVVDVAGRRHLLYNGSGYGRTGIGYATAEATL